MTPRRALVAALRRVAPGTAAHATAVVRRRRALTELVDGSRGIRAAHAALSAAHEELESQIGVLRAELEDVRLRAGAADDAIARLTDEARSRGVQVDDLAAGVAEQRGLSLRVGQLVDLVFEELARTPAVASSTDGPRDHVVRDDGH